MPKHPQLFKTSVLKTVRLSESFQRVTVGGDALVDFDWRGYDQWFRIFLPKSPGADLVLPEVSGRNWYQSYLAIPEHARPHCSNYTVAQFRPDELELDIDVVLHWDGAGELCGGVARWASGAEPGSAVALLDQGLLYDQPTDADEVLLAADETGLPAIRGVLRDLPPGTRGRAVIEVPHQDDVCSMPKPSGIELTWLPRKATQPPGELALAQLASWPTPSKHAYGFVVGESTLATSSRRALHRAGLAKSRITFSGFWKR